MIEPSLYIDGQWLDGHGEKLISQDPYNGDLLWQGYQADANAVNLAVAAARKSFKSWADLGIDGRMKYLEAYREILTSEAEALAQCISAEMGKPLWEAKTEVGAMIGKFAISVTANNERCAAKSTMVGNASHVVRFKPQGVVGVFGPFNLPCHLPNGHILPALIAGNTVVFKPSEQTPKCAALMIKYWENAGLPAGVINLVQGAKATGEALIAGEIDGLFFTGSYRVGKQIHQHFAGQVDKIVALEMGGNNALIAMDLEDIQAAAHLIIQSAFITSGQRCVCARRLIIKQGSEGDDLLAALLKQVAGISRGHYKDEPEPFMGPVISTASAKSLLAAQDELVAKGAKIILSMTADKAHPALLSPGIVDVTGIEGIDDEEFFGPLLQVIRVGSQDEAIDVANQTRFGLSAGLLSDDEVFYQKLLNRSRAGIINWNRQITGASGAAPFGGSGLSGNHRPSAYFAADYCAYPSASIESHELTLPEKLPPGLIV